MAAAWGCAVRWRAGDDGATGGSADRDGAAHGSADPQAPDGSPGPNATAAPATRPARFLRELTTAPSIVVIILSVLLGLPATILLTPDQHTTVAGQDLAVGARVPSLSVSGPAQLVQIGNTRLDVAPLRILGPLRPRITLGPVQRNAAAEAALTGSDARETATRQIADAFIRWYAWAAVLLLVIVIALVALAACLRVLFGLRRESRMHLRWHGLGERRTGDRQTGDRHASDHHAGDHHAGDRHAGDRQPGGRRSDKPQAPPRGDARAPLTVAELWQRSRTQVHAMGVGAVVTALLAWAGCGVLAYHGVVDGLTQVRSLSDLVGNYYTPPAAVGPVVPGFTGAVIGDSRAARLGGPAPDGASEEDLGCGRSSDSLAAEIAALTSVPVANLACSGASTTAGLRGPQSVNTSSGMISVPPQVGRLRQLTGLKFVVVVIGPNDLGWSDQVRYCYGVPDCTDRLTEGEFAYRLAAFDRVYGDLLRDLNDLPGAPQVVVMTSYDVFASDARCDDTRGPAGTPGLSEQNIALLADRTRLLNDVLTAGAEKYGFDVARPVLTPLCGQVSDTLGPDLQGLADPAPFHPTGIGVLRLASAVVRVLRPDR